MSAGPVPGVPDAPLGAEPGSPRRVPLVRPDNLGDVLLTQPTFRDVRRGLPGACLVLLAGLAGGEEGRRTVHRRFDPERFAADWEGLSGRPAR